MKLIIPKGSLLDPSENAAVVGGNVLTSQRIVDVVFKAFGACAASQVSPTSRSVHRQIVSSVSLNKMKHFIVCIQ